MNLGVLALIYFIIGWIYGTCVIYFRMWHCHPPSFPFMLFCWPLCLGVRIICMIGRGFDKYHVWLAQKSPRNPYANSNTDLRHPKQKREGLPS